MTSGLVNASFSLPKGQAVKMIFFAPSLPLFCTTTTWNFQKLFVGTSFSFFSFSCFTKINSVDLFWLHAEFTCVTHTSKNAVFPCDSTIASRSINMEVESAALVLTRKHEMIARPFPSVCKQYSSSNFSNVFCHSCCHIVRSSFAHTFRLTEKQHYRPSHSKCGIVAWSRSLCLNIQIA